MTSSNVHYSQYLLEVPVNIFFYRIQFNIYPFEEKKTALKLEIYNCLYSQKRIISCLRV